MAKPHVIDRPIVVDSDVLIDYFAGISPSADAVEELHEAYVGVVSVLATYLQSANPNAKARSTRVAELSQAVATDSVAA